MTSIIVSIYILHDERLTLLIENETERKKMEKNKISEALKAALARVEYATFDKWLKNHD